MRLQHNALALLFGGLLLSMIASPAVAQNPGPGVGRPYVPIQGHTGIIQERINTNEMYDGVNRIATALDLASRKNAKVYKMEAVGNIERGMAVTVQYEPSDGNPANVIDGVATEEGRVTSVDRVRGRIGVKYTDGRSETLRVTEHATPSSGTLEVKGKRVIVSSSSKSGQPVVQYFKRKS
jgi:hypothetical protein